MNPLISPRVRASTRVHFAASLLVSCLLLLVPSVPSAYADSRVTGVFQDDFCWNYFVVPCPDEIDFYWRTGTFLSPGEPPDSHAWASLVAPAGTYFFYSPPPSGKHESWNFGEFGYGYDWWVEPASMWWFKDSFQPGLAVDFGALASTFKRFPQSSYGQADVAPGGEPGFMSRTTVFWWGDAWNWYWTCSVIPPGCYQVWKHYPLWAWRTNAHPVPVRQLLPVSVGT